MDRRGRNRLDLWLRSERAFGLSYVPAPVVIEVAPSPPPPPKPAPVPSRPADAPAMRVPTPATAPKLMPPPSREPFTAPPLPREQKIERLAAIDANEVRSCPRCRLCQTRTNTVFGEGDPDARLVFIGEGPGENEDLTGRPFVGRAGELLDKQIGAMGLARGQVYICNIVKCRPPGNRAPAPDEVATCTPYLERQLEIIRPRVIVTLGLPATQYMLDTKNSMSRMRGQWHTWRGIKLMPTYHPAYVLRQYTQEVRRAVWSDLQQVMTELGLAGPARDGAGA